MHDRYGLCQQTVTVYHRAGVDSITRAVFPRAFFDRKKTVSVEKVGTSESSSFLLVIPGEGDPVSAGDKVVEGEGPECTTDAEWRDLIPTKVPGLCVIRYVDPKVYRGRQVHVEAGG